MIRKIKMRKQGGSLGAILPKAMTDRLNLAEGDEAFAIETDAGILITPYDPDFARIVEAEARISKKYQNALRELAR